MRTASLAKTVAIALQPYEIPIYRVSLVREASIAVEEDKVSSSSVAAAFLDKYFHDLDRECLAVVMLNGKHRIIGVNTVSVGSLSESVVHPREVFKPAIICNAAAVFIGHNHPSGDPSPSPQDQHVTERMKKAGELIGIPVLDHIITGENGKYYSFSDKERQLEAEEEVRENETEQKRTYLLALDKFLNSKATGSDMVVIGAYRLARSLREPARQRGKALNEVVTFLTPLLEKKNGGKAKKAALELINTANMLLKKASTS